jgi:hypothetical protein
VQSATPWLDFQLAFASGYSPGVLPIPPPKSGLEVHSGETLTHCQDDLISSCADARLLSNKMWKAISKSEFNFRRSDVAT